MIDKRIRGKMLVVVFILFVWASISPVLARAVVYVDQSRPGGNGTSWSAAYKTLEAAIAGSGSYQEFWVAEGTYTPATPLMPKEGSKFYGGFSGNETTIEARNIASFQTIVDGQLRLVHAFDIQASNVRVDGFKIQNGLASAGALEARGAGIIVGNCSGTVLVNCTFLNNSSSYSGGAVYLNNASTVTIENCLFSGNHSGFGGAIESYNTDLVVSFCQFNNNAANTGEKRGGAIRAYLKSVQIKSSIFVGNVAVQGGAVELNDNPGSVIQCSEFRSNRAESSDPTKGAGGAVALMYVNNASSVPIRQCLFQANVSSLEGGGVYSYKVPVEVQDSRFIGNRAVNGGGVMLDYKTTQPNTVQRCFFVGNTATTTGGALCSWLRSMDIEDSVFSYNSAPSAGAIRPAGDINYSACPVTMKYCTLYGNVATGPTASDGSGNGGAMLNIQIQLFLYNSIFWGNTATSPLTPDIYNARTSLETWNTDLQSLAIAPDSVVGTHHSSFAEDPQFEDPNGADNISGTMDDNFRLLSTSPCINQANDTYKTTCDLSPATRVVPSDIGAYERFVSTPASCSSSISCPVFPTISPPPITPPSIPSPTPPKAVISPVFMLLLKNNN